MSVATTGGTGIASGSGRPKNRAETLFESVPSSFGALGSRALHFEYLELSIIVVVIPKVEIIVIKAELQVKLVRFQLEVTS